jgi:hypothetical protein
LPHPVKVNPGTATRGSCVVLEVGDLAEAGNKTVKKADVAPDDRAGSRPATPTHIPQLSLLLRWLTYRRAWVHLAKIAVGIPYTRIVPHLASSFINLKARSALRTGPTVA